MAARRMNGVVKPHATPTSRKPSVQRNSDGDEGEGTVSTSMAACELSEQQVCST